MKKLPVSLVVITLNEEKHIERCLRSFPVASDIVVLDSGSQDRTVEIAKACGARVFVEPFKGYRAQKQRVTELAQFDWVLTLDADEMASAALVEEIENLFLDKTLNGVDSRFDAFEVRRANYHLGRWISHGGWYPDRALRFFNRKNSNWVGGNIHEKVASQKTGRLEGHVLHWVFDSISDQVTTNDRYSGLGAKDIVEKGGRFSLFRLVTKPISKFIETYFFKKGFLDGLPGLIISVGASYSAFLKFAKVWEIQNLQDKSESDFKNFSQNPKFSKLSDQKRRGNSK